MIGTVVYATIGEELTKGLVSDECGEINFGKNCSLCNYFARLKHLMMVGRLIWKRSPPEIEKRSRSQIKRRSLEPRKLLT
ncbi:hypothetical protein H6F77_16615 [Microcoleus sp. FACHB-831]|uniref:hypothetical protein n=1 Tax=Microcoleus sp. FACHB-831 TaxID=2692827 RepID=UPI001681D1CE|nr:hypothetical protein [Microcoleus sp. FACHB-831]MBD1922686.1 hypothetical protein [Microcoleus sp. FACHB-831]